MLLRQRMHPEGDHVDRHPPRGTERVINATIFVLGVIGFGRILLLIHSANSL